jgi:hypothetical protein
MTDHTSELIKCLTGTVNEMIPCFYEEAPERAEFHYAILTGINGYDIGAGDGVAFILEFYTGEQLGQSEDLDATIDAVRTALDGACIHGENTFSAHIGFNSRSGMDERSYDLCRRRLNFTARTFFIG